MKINIKQQTITSIAFLLIFVAGNIIGISLFQYTRTPNNIFQVVTTKKNKKDKAKVDNRKYFDDITSNVSNQSESFNKPVEKNFQNKKIPPVVVFDSNIHIKDRAYIIAKEDIKWHKPVLLNDLGLTKKEVYLGCGLFSSSFQKQCLAVKKLPTTFIKYVKIGTGIKGEYKDNDLIMIYFYSDNLMLNEIGTSPMYIFKKGDKITFIQNTENSNISKSIKDNFLNGDYEFTIDTGARIKALNLPDVFIGNNDRQVLEKNKYSTAFFTNIKLKPVFMSKEFGQVWMTDNNKLSTKNVPYELNSYLSYDDKNKKFIKKYKDIFKEGAFFVKAPNGLAVSYKLKFDIFDNRGILKATWDDGVINKEAYSKTASSYNDDAYVDDETGKVSINKDLRKVGHTILGDPLYTYKNDSSKSFKYFYKNIYHEKKGEKKGFIELMKLYPVVFWVDPSGRLLAFYRSDLMEDRAEMGKPVIYLYPKIKRSVQVQVKPNQGIIQSEPKYPLKGWQVIAKPNGEIYFNGQKYPYLFWEGSSNIYYKQPKYGWVVDRNKLNIFFDNKLKQLGLIQKEINDFKDFWIPEINKSDKPYYFITFLSQEKINQLAPLSIVPQPDTIIRVMMDYKGLDTKEKVPELKIKTPERRGFTAVEWGGMLK